MARRPGNIMGDFEMPDETIVAIFDTAAHAQAAVQDLLAAHVPQDAISTHADMASNGTATTGSAMPTQKPGLWASIFGGEPDHDTAVYSQSVQSGSSVVTIKAPDQHVSSVVAILERHNPVDIDERASNYGLTQTAASTSAMQPLGADARSATAGDEVLQLSEEQLVVGKRLVNRGTTRIRRFVVEVPVEEQVSLHEETVKIERHAVTGDRPVSGTAFTDRTIEMTQTGEEAVVGKTARVREEVSLRKEVVDRVETVKDTVRREDVEIVKAPAETVVGKPSKV